jgi:hypothetical protein
VVGNLAPATTNGLVADIVFGHGLVLAFQLEKNKKNLNRLKYSEKSDSFFFSDMTGLFK